MSVPAFVNEPHRGYNDPGVAMMFRAVALLILGQAHAGPVEWVDDLPAARARASRENKVILLRQIVCDCSRRECLYRRSAEAPAFTQSEEVRRALAERFVCVVTHVAPDSADFGLVHPRGVPIGLPRRPFPVRTLFISPSLHVLHRPSLCPRGDEMESELAFVEKVRSECFPRGWEAARDLQARLSRLHLEHSLAPWTWHRRLEPSPHSECACRVPLPRSGSVSLWAGYDARVPWHSHLGEAQDLAARSGRLLLYFQVVGDLSRGGC